MAASTSPSSSFCLPRLTSDATSLGPLAGAASTGGLSSSLGSDLGSDLATVGFGSGLAALGSDFATVGLGSGLGSDLATVGLGSGLGSTFATVGSGFADAGFGSAGTGSGSTVGAGFVAGSGLASAIALPSGLGAEAGSAAGVPTLATAAGFAASVGVTVDGAGATSAFGVVSAAGAVELAVGACTVELVSVLFCDPLCEMNSRPSTATADSAAGITQRGVFCFKLGASSSSIRPTAVVGESDCANHPASPSLPISGGGDSGVRSDSVVGCAVSASA